MSLSLLAPLGLLAALAVGVPLLLHLIDQRKVPLQDFPALRFLVLAQKKLKKRRRLRDHGLLLLRLLGVIALALAASAPVLAYRTEIPAGAELAPNVLFLLDRSMSMGYLAAPEDTLFDRALARMGQVVERLPEGSRAGLVVFDERPEDRIGGVTPDLRRVLRVAEAEQVGYGQTDLRAAILAGVRALLATPEGGGDLYLLSDLTAASLPGPAALELPGQLEGKIRVVVPTLHEGPRPNRTLLAARVEADGATAGARRVLAQVRAQGQGSGGEVPLDLTLGEQALSRGFVELADDGMVEKPFTLPDLVDMQGQGKLTLEGDALPQDDTFYFRVSQRRQLTALIIDGEPGSNLTDAESYFLERALLPKATAASRITPMVTGEGAVPRLTPQEQAVVFMLNVSEPSALAPQLQAYVEAGGGLFIAVGGRVTPERYNRALRDLLPAALGETIAASWDVTGEQPPSLGFPPVHHPVFRVFREAGAPEFGTTRFYRVMPTAPALKTGAEVLLKYSTGLPALLMRTVGKGRVFLFTSSLDRDWSNFPVKSIFLPFVQESTHYLAQNPLTEEGAADLRVGAPASLVVPPSAGTLSVLTPGGEKLDLPPPTEGDTPEGEEGLLRRLFTETRLPGVYRVSEKLEDGREEARPDLDFVVNVPLAESDLSPLSPDSLRERLPGIPIVVEGQQGGEQATVTVERTRKLDLLLTLTLMALLLAEGAWLLRRSRLTRTAEES